MIRAVIVAPVSAVLVLTACSDDSQAPVLTRGTTSLPVSAECAATPPGVSVPLTGLQDFMTLPPGNDLLDFTVRADPSVVCVGAEVRLAISARNRGPDPLQVAPRLVLTEVLPHLVLVTLDPIVIPPNGEVHLQAVVTVPPLPEGSYELFVSNGSQRGGATITISNDG